MPSSNSSINHNSNNQPQQQREIGRNHKTNEYQLGKLADFPLQGRHRRT